MVDWEVPKSVLAALPIGITVASGILYFSIRGDLTIPEDSIISPVSEYVLGFIILLSALSVFFGVVCFVFIAKAENSGEEEDKRKAVVASNLLVWSLLFTLALLAMAAILNLV